MTSPGTKPSYPRPPQSLNPSWSDYEGTNLYKLRLDVYKYSAVIQTTRSTPSGTQLTQYPSSSETIRQRNSRPGVRLPHFIGRRSTKTRARPLAKRYPRWTLREVPPELSTTGEIRKPRIPLRHSRATERRDEQIGRTRQFRGEQTAKFQGSTTGPGKAP